MTTLIAFSALLSHAFAAPQEPLRGDGPEVTIYNQGFGFIKELRKFDLKQGRQTISVVDVPALIDPSSVAIRSLLKPDSIQLLEQNYEYDLINPVSILNKSVGGRIRLVRHFGATNETLEGTLLSAPTAVVGSADGSSSYTYNGLVLKLDDGHFILNPVGEIEVMKMPEGLISQPTLRWDLIAESAGINPVELRYITQGMTWEANYVLNLNEGSQKASLQAWVTVTNNSGARFTNAKLKLLAGDVHQAPQYPRGGGGFGGAGSRMMSADAAKFAEESLFEYHLYTLQRPATLVDKQIKQLSLFQGFEIPYTKRLIIDSTRFAGIYHPSEGEIGTGNLKPEVRIEFVNDEASHLGQALPKGKFRITQNDKSGSSQLLGEDTIDHTPQGEKVSLLVGRAFDVVSNRKRLSFERLGPSAFREKFEVEVRNRKKEATDVEVIERHYGDWRITEESEPSVKADAISAVYHLKLKPNEVRKVTYTVETRW